MSFIRASGLGPLTASNTATIVDPATPVNGIARMSPLVSFASVTASGTSVTFTGIPSWARRVTMLFNAVSTSGTSSLIIQLGTSGGFTTSGYTGGVGGAGGYSANAAGMQLINGSGATSSWSGSTMIGLVDSSSNVWTCQSVLGDALSAGTYGYNFAGWSIALSGVATQIRLTTVNGTDTFDAGKVNVMYE